VCWDDLPSAFSSYYSRLLILERVCSETLHFDAQLEHSHNQEDPITKRVIQISSILGMNASIGGLPDVQSLARACTEFPTCLS
jgi:hypothetical protein